jgi:F0F1-type ATP synthase delta subunit
MEEAYAQALWRIVEGGMAPKKAVELLYASLSARGRQGLMPRIIRAFERLAARRERAEGVTLTVAREKDLYAARHMAKEALASVGGSKDVNQAIDPTLIGGWRLEGRGTLIDESFKKQLMTLYNRSTRD